MKKSSDLVGTYRNRVLVYHKVDSRLELGLTRISPLRFEQQIKFLLSQGFQPVTLAELFFVQSNKKRIAITFDDGYQNIYQYAFPILQKFDLKATIFIITSCIGRDNYWDVHPGGIHFNHLKGEEIEQLLAAGWEVGSHAVTHRALTELSLEEIEWELHYSKNYLEREFHIPVRFLSVPFGKSNRNILQLAVKAGYQGVCGFYPFRYYFQGASSLEIPRLAVYATDSFQSLMRKLSPEKPGYFEVLKQNCINFCANGTLLINSIR